MQSLLIFGPEHVGFEQVVAVVRFLYEKSGWRSETEMCGGFGIVLRVGKIFLPLRRRERVSFARVRLKNYMNLRD